MPKANAAPSVLVKIAVWVMNPGPMAEVAIRNTAAVSEARRETMIQSGCGTRP